MEHGHTLTARKGGAARAMPFVAELSATSESARSVAGSGAESEGERS
jgi:hypothetical protein